MSVNRVSVRYDRKEGEFVMRCDSCAASGQTKAYWPLSLEFWNPTCGLQVCRACHNLRRRMARRQTPEERRAKQRAYYWSHRDHRLAWRHAYHAQHRDEINARRRARYAERRAKLPVGLWDEQ